MARSLLMTEAQVQQRGKEKRREQEKYVGSKITPYVNYGKTIT